MNLRSVLLTALTLASATTSWAGNEKGNGGGAHLCGNAVETYDLFEGRARYGLEETRFPEMDREEILALVLDRALRASPENAFLIKEIIKSLELVRSRMLMTNARLVTIDDANELMVGNDCQYVQLGNWDDRTGSLFVAEKLFVEIHRSPIDEAAFFLHEAVYRVARTKLGKTNSTSSREVVARMIYGQGIRHLFAILKE